MFMSIEFKIESDKPAPKKSGKVKNGEIGYTRKLNETLRQLDPGQSFEVNEERRGTLNWQLSLVRGELNRDFTIRKTSNGKIRVWRIK